MGFEEIYNTYVDHVYSYLKFNVYDETLVQDLLQDTFLAVYENLSKITDQNALKSWILSIAHHKMVDKFRKQKGETIGIPEQMKEEMTYDESPLETIFIHQLLSRLDDVSQQILYGIYVEQLTCEEIGKMLNLPTGTVKSKSHYARTKLKQWLKEDKQGWI